MPSNPLTQQELYDYGVLRSITPPAEIVGLAAAPYFPAGYFFATPYNQNGPTAWRKFNAGYISEGIIDPNRLGTGSTGAGNLYLADDGTWKAVSGGGVTTLDGLSDVTISAPANAQVLAYNSTTSQWENQTPTGGGGGGDMNKSTYDVDNDGVVDSAERTEIIVRNSTGSTLTKGTIVYLSGATGNRPNAVRAQAHTVATSSKTIGIVVRDINNNSDGYVATNGTLHDLNTSAFTAGDSVWLSATTAGAITSTVPAEPNHAVFIGWIARSHPNQGRIVLHIQNGYEFDELHGVLLSSQANNDLLVYESSTALWKNKSISTIFGGTPLVSVPTLAQVTTAGNTTTNAITVGLINSTALRAVVTITDTTGGINNPSYFGSYDNFLQLSVNRNPSTGVFAQTGKASSQISLEGDNGASSIRFYTATVNNVIPSERMRIFGGGNIAIGTITDAGYKLDVTGSIRATGDAIVNYMTASNGVSINQGADLRSSDSIVGWRIRDPFGGAYLYNNSGPFLFHTTRFEIRDNSTSVKHFTANSTGVTIGSTAPATKLYIQGGAQNWNETAPGLGIGTIHMNADSTVDNAGNAITFGYQTGTQAQAGIYVRTSGGYGTKMYFATTNAFVDGSKTRMMIDHLGNVGIGTVSPTHRLHIEGDTNTSGIFRVGGVAGWTGTIVIATNPPGQQNIQVKGGIITNVS